MLWYDAKGCFDCIEHIATILVLMQVGIAYSVATTLFSILQKVMHTIKTGCGVSEPVYGNEERPLASIGQGIGLRLVLWCLNSSIVINMCKAKGNGMTITSSISKMEASLIVSAFVNDADLVSGCDDVNATGNELIPKFQASMLR